MIIREFNPNNAFGRASGNWLKALGCLKNRIHSSIGDKIKKKAHVSLL